MSGMSQIVDGVSYSEKATGSRIITLWEKTGSDSDSHGGWSERDKLMGNIITTPNGEPEDTEFIGKDNTETYVVEEKPAGFHIKTA